MAGGFGQYIQETRAELNHVAWPTRTQTVVYAVLVAAISVGISLYLGFFDFLFTSGLTRAVEFKAQRTEESGVVVTPNIDTSAQTAPATEGGAEPTLTLPTNKVNNQ